MVFENPRHIPGGFNKDHKNGDIITVSLTEESRDSLAWLSYVLGSEGELQKSFTDIFGFSDIVLDEDNRANITQMNEYSNVYDDTYSL
ncbi:hypothetical protein [Amphibacillus sediminis]|uniref:hypothetical protein n=1 Tax=Amphibacillus sediminis TaxID=360185 RepID=UPI00082D6A86|nr:hypothetical protein [Amphibacillus sediminis]